MTTRQARKAKGVYGKWKEENLQLALVAISEGVGVNEAARRYNIPSATLKRYNKRKDAKIRQPGHPLDLPQEVENDLVTHLLQLEKMFYG